MSKLDLWEINHTFNRSVHMRLKYVGCKRVIVRLYQLSHEQLQNVDDSDLRLSLLGDRGGLEGGKITSRAGSRQRRWRTSLIRGRLVESASQHLTRSCQSPSDIPESLGLAGILGRSPRMTMNTTSAPRRG